MTRANSMLRNSGGGGGSGGIIVQVSRPDPDNPGTETLIETTATLLSADTVLRFTDSDPEAEEHNTIKIVSLKPAGLQGPPPMFPAPGGNQVFAQLDATLQTHFTSSNASSSNADLSEFLKQKTSATNPWFVVLDVEILAVKQATSDAKYWWYKFATLVTGVDVDETEGSPTFGHFTSWTSADLTPVLVIPAIATAGASAWTATPSTDGAGLVRVTRVGQASSNIKWAAYGTPRITPIPE